MKDEQTMIAICDALASGVKSLSGAARSSGVASRTFWNWMRASQKGDDRFLIRWPDPEAEQPMPFHKAIAFARKVFLMQVRAQFEHEALVGWEKPVHFQGQMVWQEDPRAVGLSPELRDLLGFSPDGLLRDETGACIPVTEHVHPPVAMTIKVLESHFAEYRSHSVVDQNINGNLTMGVTAIKPLSKSDSPPAIPPMPPLPRIERAAPMPEPDPIIDASSGDDPDDDFAVTDTRPEKDQPLSAMPPAELMPPQVVIREDARQTNYAPTGGTATSPLAQDLLARLRGDPR
jgi:hypothetical protein